VSNVPREEQGYITILLLVQGLDLVSCFNIHKVIGGSVLVSYADRLGKREAPKSHENRFDICVELTAIGLDFFKACNLRAETS
jgi:hypothetical protein